VRDGAPIGGTGIATAWRLRDRGIHPWRPDAESAKAAAAVQFNLDEVRRNRIMVQEMG
jgi:hypothetical protein